MKDHQPTSIYDQGLPLYTEITALKDGWEKLFGEPWKESRFHLSKPKRHVTAQIRQLRLKLAALYDPQSPMDWLRRPELYFIEVTADPVRKGCTTQILYLDEFLPQRRDNETN